MRDHNDLWAHAPGFWLHKRVLLTGHTGFLGSWIASRLSGLGADVVGVARLPASPSSLFERAGLAAVVTSRTLDLRHRSRVEQVTVEEAPEIVIHLATGAGGIGIQAAGGLKRPLASFDANATGTLNLLNALRRVPEARAVVVVTDAAAVGPDLCPWRASLACAELVAQSYRATYLLPADGVGLATLRACPLIGGGDDGDTASLLRATATGDLAPHPPLATLPHAFLHVLDGVEACLGLAVALCRAPERCARTWALGPLDSEACGVALAEALGRPAVPAVAPAGRASGLAAASPLARRPALDAGTAVAWTIEGYRRLAREAHAGFLVEQIDRLATLGATPSTSGAAAMAASSSPAVNAKARDVLLTA